MDQYRRYLWYILPGSIALFPLYFLIRYPFNFSSFLGGFLLLAFIVGAIIHQIYRLFYHKVIFYNRPHIGLFIEKINKKYEGKKQFKLSKEKDKKIVDPLYSVLINGNEKYKSFCGYVSNISFYITFLGTSIVALLFSLFVLLYITLVRFLPLISLIIIVITTFLLQSLFFINLKLKNDSDVAFVSRYYKEFLPENEEEIGAMINDLR